MTDASPTPSRRERRRRRGVIVAFLMISIAATVGLAISATQYRRTSHEIAHVKKLTKSLNAQVAQQKKLTKTLNDQETELRATRSAQVSALQAAAVLDCDRLHNLDGVIEGIVTDSLKQSSETANIGSTPEQRAAIEALTKRSQANLHRYLASLVASDCTNVKPLPPLGSGG